MKKVHRIDGVLEETCGHLGCGKSHIKALEFAIKQGWKSVMILEDDFSFSDTKENVHSKLNGLNTIDNWDAVMMMCNVKNENKQPTQYPFLNKLKRCTGAMAYIVKKHYYETLLANFKESVEIMTKQLQTHIANEDTKMKKLHYCTAIDQHWNLLIKKDNFYVFDPVLGKHDNKSYSDNNCSIQFQKNKRKEII